LLLKLFADKIAKREILNNKKRKGAFSQEGYHTLRASKGGEWNKLVNQLSHLY